MPSFTLTPIALAVGEVQLVPVYHGAIGGVPVAVVNARELHTYLENGDLFANWIKARIEKYGFLENQDFESFLVETKKPQGGRPATDYLLTFDMAKELSMVENNAKGREARRYFIAMERRVLESQGQTVPPGNTDQPAFRRPPLQAEMFGAQADPIKMSKLFGSCVRMSKLAGLSPVFCANRLNGA